MMTSDTMPHVGNPVALLFAPQGSALHGMSEGLACREFEVVVAGSLEDFTDVVNSKQYNICACVIDADAAADVMDAVIYAAPDRLIDENGPIILVETSSNDGDCHRNVSRIIEAQDGQRSLRLVVSIEIEEFQRCSSLREEIKRRTSAIGLIVSGEFRIQTRREAQNLATMLSLTCPNPVPIAIGLTELLINGVEHGCLGIGYEEKGILIEEGVLAETIEKRRQNPKYRDRFVMLKYWRSGQEMHFVVEDQGDGFDYEAFLGDAEGHNRKHGRGITMASSCFDTLEYRGKGNEVYVVHSVEE